MDYGVELSVLKVRGVDLGNSKDEIGGEKKTCLGKVEIRSK